MPSPLKSRCPTIDQVVDTLPSPAVAKTCAPFISDMAMLPPVSRHAMSLLPLPLKSWVFTVIPRRPILSPAFSVNQSAPSGPVVMPQAPL